MSPPIRCSPCWSPWCSGPTSTMRGRPRLGGSAAHPGQGHLRAPEAVARRRLHHAPELRQRRAAAAHEPGRGRFGEGGSGHVGGATLLHRAAGRRVRHRPEPHLRGRAGGAGGPVRDGAGPGRPARRGVQRLRGAHRQPARGQGDPGRAPVRPVGDGGGPRAGNLADRRSAERHGAGQDGPRSDAARDDARRRGDRARALRRARGRGPALVGPLPLREPARRMDPRSAGDRHGLGAHRRDRPLRRGRHRAEGRRRAGRVRGGRRHPVPASGPACVRRACGRRAGAGGGGAWLEACRGRDRVRTPSPRRADPFPPPPRPDSPACPALPGEPGPPPCARS